MGRNHMWGIKSKCESPVYVVLFVSRNKDNKAIENFKERRKSFLSADISFPIIGEHLMRQFLDFVDAGVPGEVSRCYCSVNDRDMSKVHKELLHFLIDNDDFNLCSIESKVAGIAATKECANSKKWLFDFDIKDEHAVKEFIEEIRNIDSSIEITCLNTPNGYAVITSRGFDIRMLSDGWQWQMSNESLTLKRDDLALLSWQTKE